MTSLVYGPITSLVRKHHCGLFKIDQDLIDHMMKASLKAILK